MLYKKAQYAFDISADFECCKGHEITSGILFDLDFAQSLKLFCSESQTIEDFGRELRLQRADVEHLRRWDSSSLLSQNTTKSNSRQK